MEEGRCGSHAVEECLRCFMQPDVEHKSPDSTSLRFIENRAHDVHGGDNVGIRDIAVKNRTYAMLTVGKHVHTTFMTPCGEDPRVHLYFEAHNVRLDRARIQADRIVSREALGQSAGVLDISRQLSTMVIEGVQGGGREDPRLPHTAPILLLKTPGSFDHRLRTDQRGADRRSEALAEADVHRVEGLRVIPLGYSGSCGCMPETGSIEVQRQVTLTTHRAHRVQVLK